MELDDTKSCCSCKVETGSIIFGIFTAIFTGVVSLFTMGILIYVLIMFPKNDDLEKWNYELVFLSTLAGCSLVSFLFSVLLVNGVCKKRPNQVLAYFIFGTVVIVVSMAITLTVKFIICILDDLLAFLAIALILLYTVPLTMVMITYKKLKSATDYRVCDHKPLET